MEKPLINNDFVRLLVQDGKLEAVVPNPREAAGWLKDAQTHLLSCKLIAESDPKLAYDALHSAVRKSMAALLLAQGLRPTRAGGHEVVIDAINAQASEEFKEVLRPARRIKRKRHLGDYGDSSSVLTPKMVLADLQDGQKIVDYVARILPLQAPWA
ncbi:MAG: hypothetical protein WCH42_08010 [Actinomycetes bacterium]